MYWIFLSIVRTMFAPGSIAVRYDLLYQRPGSTTWQVCQSTGWVYNSCPACGQNHATEESRGSQIDVWALEQSIDRGYAAATFYNGDIDPDRPDVREGIERWIAKKEKPDPHDWGTIAAWAWGIHRAVDYLVDDKDVDASSKAKLAEAPWRKRDRPFLG